MSLVIKIHQINKKKRFEINDLFIKPREVGGLLLLVFDKLTVVNDLYEKRSPIN